MIESNRLPALAVGDHWLARLADHMRGELDRASQSLAGRGRQLAELYASPLPKLVREVGEMSARADGHLRTMGFHS
jgi:type I restriction enzyme M protein